jgi:hypothetical protein
MLTNGYNLINEQINLGGESPNYATNDVRYRAADAALLNLIFPCNYLDEARFTLQQKEKIFDIVSTLNTEYGVKRYDYDNYQSGNF